jgi:hypothetical protein
MTTSITDATVRAQRARPGFALCALAIVIPVGPAAVAVLRGVLPYNTTDANAVVAAKVAAHQSAEMAVLWLALLATLTLVPAVIAVGLLARRHAPILGTIALVLSFVGFINLSGPGVTSDDTIALGAARIQLNPVPTGHLIDSVLNLPPVGLGTMLFVVGHILGGVLLGAALWRARVIPTWAAALIAVSQPLHLVFAVFLPDHLFDALAWGLLAVGFAVVAVGMLHDGEVGTWYRGTRSPVPNDAR